MRKKTTIKIRIMKQQEILNEITNTENTEKNTTLIERKTIEGSPFVIIKRETGSMLTMGKYQISPEMEEEEIPIWMIENEWNIITTICVIVAEDVKNNKNIRNNNQSL